MGFVKQIGDIQLFAELHRGAQTVVYKGFQKTLDRTVLVKFLPATSVPGESSLLDFQREARLIAQVQHPNVVTIHDFGQNEDGCYFVAEFVEGLSLRELLASGPLPPELALFVLRQVCEGLLSAHQKKILHKDIKPENILISDTGEVKLADFGLAVDQAIRSEQGDVLAGTAGYLPPEIIGGEKSEFHSDIFSLGATFYEMLCGERAFNAADLQTSLAAILNDDPIPYLKQKQLPEGLVAICSKMLAKNPRERYPACQALLSDLGAIEAHYDRKISSADLADFVKEPAQYKPAGMKPESQIPGQRAGAIRQPISRYKVAGAAALVLIASVLTWSFISSSSQSADKQVAESDFLQPNEVTQLANLDPNDIHSRGQEVAEKSSQDTPSVNENKAERIRNERQQATKQIVAAETNGMPDRVEPDVSPMALGFLHISCQPWGEVFVDGDSIGVTPLAGPLALPAGAHTLVFRNGEFPVHQITIELGKDESKTVDFSFWNTIAKLHLEVSPWAEVYIDDVYKDTVPPQTRPIILVAGQHMLKLKHPGMGEWRTEIKAVAGETLSLKFNLKNLLNPQHQ